MHESPHGLNVKVTLDRAAPVPLRTQIIEQLRDAITEGVVAPDDPLPSSRSLAAALGVSRTTVLSCYLELEGAGWIRSAHGAGTFVARRDIVADSPRPVPRAERGTAEQPLYDLRPGSLDPTLVRRSDLQRVWRRGRPSSTPAPTCGLPEMREALAAYLGPARGLPCSADEIVVCAGTGDAIAVLSAALGWPQKAVGVENPGYRDIRNVLRRMAVAHAPIDVTDPDAIPRQLWSAQPLAGLILTPSHQYPLGHRLTEATRRAVIEWADATRAVVVEDDYDAEFSFGIAPSTTMAGLSPMSNVVFVGTLSKVFDPGLRVAYLRVPPHLAEAVRSARDDIGPAVPTAIQQGVTALIASGDLSRHIARVRRIYGDRRRALLQELRDFPSVVNLVGIDAGLHVVAELAPSVDAAAVVAEARTRGVALLDLDEFRCHGTSGPPGLVLGYSAHPVAALRRAMEILRTVPC